MFYNCFDALFIIEINKYIEATFHEQL